MAYVDIDNPGIIGTSVPNSRSAPEIKGFLLQVVDEVWGNEGIWKMPYKGGDQSFFGVGVPYISFATGYTQEELERLNWAFLSPWLHTEADTLDKVDKDLYDKHLDFFGTLVLRLCHTERVPYDLSNSVAMLKSQLEALRELAADAEAIDLEGLIECAGRLEMAVIELWQNQPSDEAPHRVDAVRIINEASTKASRELSFLWTEADKYDQDPYGYWLIGKPVPRLYVPVVRLAELEPGSQAFNLWMTKFVRERNRVSDAIGRAADSLAWAAVFLEECK